MEADANMSRQHKLSAAIPAGKSEIRSQTETSTLILVLRCYWPGAIESPDEHP
jgi:hypothetical protein